MHQLQNNFKFQMTYKPLSGKHQQAYYESKFRMSMPTFQTNPIRCSFSSKCQNKPYYRSSDMSNILNIPSTAKKDIYRRKQPQENLCNLKTSHNLLTTLNFLQQKLLSAKNQLRLGISYQLSEFSAELNTVKQCVEDDELSFSSSLLQKMEQSTINLQSQKILIDTVKSKQQLILKSKIMAYYVAQVAQGVAGINQRALEHLTLSLQILRNLQINNLPMNPFWNGNKVNLPVKPENVNKMVLVLDLDETLIHCEKTRMSSEDLETDILIDNTVQKAYYSIRPYALSFLKKVKKNFQVIVFTASLQCYADAVIDQIDPQGKLIDHRLYRNHCVKLFNKIYTKDLNILNRDLSKTVLVDNSPFSYLYHIQNGIPILSYTGGADNQLLKLQKYLEQLSKQKDVRHLNLKTFKLNKYQNYANCQLLVKQLYSNDHQ